MGLMGHYYLPNLNKWTFALKYFTYVFCLFNIDLDHFLAFHTFVDSLGMLKDNDFRSGLVADLKEDRNGGL